MGILNWLFQNGTKQHQKKPDNDTINYFLGVAQLADNNEIKAITFLKKHNQLPKSILYK